MKNGLGLVGWIWLAYSAISVGTGAEKKVTGAEKEAEAITAVRFQSLPIQFVSALRSEESVEPRFSKAPFSDRLGSDVWRSQSFDPDEVRGYLIRTTLAGGMMGVSVVTWVILRRRWQRDPRGISPHGTRLELIDQLAVGARCSVQLIRVNDQFIVIGRDAQGLKAMVPIWPSFGAWSANLEDQQEHGTVEHELAVTHE